jgi:hypothetical protein
MATVTGYTAERMKQIEDSAVVDGDVVGNNLILTKHDGSTIDAGSVRGPAGPQGPPGAQSIVVCTSTTRPTSAPTLFVGLNIYETDTEKMYVWNGTGWRPREVFTDIAANSPTFRPLGLLYFVNDANLPIGAASPEAASRPITPGLYQWLGATTRWQPPWNMPWGYMGIKKLSVAQSSIVTAVDVTGLTITMTAIAGRQLEIRADLPLLSSVDADLARIDICDQAGAIKDGRQFRMSTSGIGCVATEWLPTTTGSLTRKVQVSRSAGTGNIQVACGGTTIGKLTIIDHGPAAVAA